MEDMQDPDPAMDEHYDEEEEEEDSDFQQGSADEELSSSDDDDDEGDATGAQRKPRKRRKLNGAHEAETTAEIHELDSGDEATIKERRTTRPKGDAPGDGDGDEWRPRTRAMRMLEKAERRSKKLATKQGSTVDVDQLWEAMNRPLAMPVPSDSVAPPLASPHVDGDAMMTTGSPASACEETNEEHTAVPDADDMITIKRSYKFAGEIHVEEKWVPRSSAEAQLWLAQQSPGQAEESQAGRSATALGAPVNRPLRKVSRFDPNATNLGAFSNSWARPGARFKGPKLNVIEKSKMDWAVHVDAAGLNEELATHAKAKEGYLTRMDFLRDVEARREGEARTARLKGR